MSKKRLVAMGLLAAAGMGAVQLVNPAKSTLGQGVGKALGAIAGVWIGSELVKA